MKIIETLEDLEMEIRRAVLILSSLPKEGPRRLSSCWPSLPATCINPEDEDLATVTNFRPLPEEVDDMDIVFEDWFKVLNYKEKQMVYLRCLGWEWKRIQRFFPVARSTLCLNYKKALTKILKHIQKQGVAAAVKAD